MVRMNKLTPDEIETVNTYNKHAKAWISEHNDDDFYVQEYQNFNKLLPVGKILEIGCGAGRDAQKLIAQGYEYVGTDVAEKLLESSRKRIPQAKFKRVDVYSLNFKEKFDGFWCAAVLLHIPRNRITEALSSISSQIKSGGVGFISTKQGTSNMLEALPYDASSKRLQVHYTKKEFDNALFVSGFEIVSYNFRPLSERSKWMCYFVRKI